jgi:hypothetical protein
MLPLAADENFRSAIIRGVLRRLPACDIVRVQDAGLSGASDPDVLAWAAREGRVLLTHDAATCIDDAYARVRASEPMPGLFVVLQSAPIGQVIDDVIVLIECSLEAEWEGRVLFLPIHNSP